MSVFLYIGGAQLGVSVDVLLPLRTYAQHYSAQVVHLGPLATDDEIKMFRLRTKKLKTWERQLEELSGSTSLSPEEEAQLVGQAYKELVEMGRDSAYLVNWETLTDEDLSQKDITRLVRMLISHINCQKINRELALLCAAQEQRIAVLSSMFPNIRWVFSEHQVIDFSALTLKLETYMGTEMLGRHIDALAMPANGVRVAHPPITKRTINILARSGRSAILPHPTPMSESRSAEGLNNARNYFTTGGLSIPSAPTGSDDLHKGLNLPGAVVCVYAEDGAFFANNLIVECRKATPFIAEDGLVFKGKSSPIFLKGEDTAIILQDLHAPYEHPGVVNGAIYVGKRMSANTIILNGDIIDHEADNRHASGMPGLVEGKRTRNDLDAGKRLVDKIIEGIGAENTIYILGNHELWLTNLVEKLPSLKGLLDWPTVAKEWFGRCRVILRKAGGNTLFRFGSLTPRHGDEESLQAATEALGDVINGHWHRYYRVGQSGIGGAGCRLGPAYVGNNLTAWQSQFETLSKHEELTQTSYKTCLHNDEEKTSRFVFRNHITTVTWGA